MSGAMASYIMPIDFLIECVDARFFPKLHESPIKREKCRRLITCFLLEQAVFCFLVSCDLTLIPVACQRRALMFGGQL
jgi:hypothetical protein